MKIEYRLPSKNVQYGYVNVEGTEEELDGLDYLALGRRYIASVQSYWNGEELQVDQAIALDELTKLGQEIEATPEAKAFDLKDEPKKKRKVETVVDAEQLLTDELGATKISEEVYDEPVAEPEKPWAAPAAFDFDN